MKDAYLCLQQDYFRVPDGTHLNPFLNPLDVMSKLSPDLFDGQISITAGQLAPGMHSQIHVHPHITQMTLVLAGVVNVTMKDPLASEAPYTVGLTLPETDADKLGFTTAAVVVPPGTFMQLQNPDATTPANVLYVCTPGYVFELNPDDPSDPIYDDAIALGMNWETLEQQSWNPPKLAEPKYGISAREATISRLKSRHSGQ